MDESTLEIIYLISAVLGIVVFCAMLKLFTIARLLTDIRAELWKMNPQEEPGEEVERPQQRFGFIADAQAAQHDR